MERRRRAFAENDKDFKELFGVKEEIFLQMHAILTAAALERRKKGGRRPALSPGDPLFLTLQYWRGKLPTVGPHHETSRLRFWHR